MKIVASDVKMLRSSPAGPIWLKKKKKQGTQFVYESLNRYWKLLWKGDFVGNDSVYRHAFRKDSKSINC